MKNSILLIGLLFIISCGNTSSDTSTTVKTPATTVALPDQTQPEPLDDPCQLPASEIAGIIGWKNYSEGKSNAISSERLKVCDYSTKLSGSLSISFTRHKVTNPNGKYLEKAFTSTLNQSSKKMTFQEVAGGFGDQTIYGFGQDGPNNVYILQWRFGNHTEKRLYLRATKKRNADKTLGQLKKIAEKL